MNHSSGKKDSIFFAIVFVLFYLITFTAVPYMGIKMDFLSFGGLIHQSTVKPDLIFALVLCTAILSSGRRAVVLGIIFGFIVDITCSVPMMSSVCYCLCGLYAYSFSSSFAGRGAVNAMLVGVPMLLMRALVSTFYLLGTWHNISFIDIMLGAVLPEYIYNILAVGAVYLVTKLLMRIFRVEEMI